LLSRNSTCNVMDLAKLKNEVEELENALLVRHECLILVAYTPNKIVKRQKENLERTMMRVSRNTASNEYALPNHLQHETQLWPMTFLALYGSSKYFFSSGVSVTLTAPRRSSRLSNEVVPTIGALTTS